MSHWSHLNTQDHEPAPGELIALLDADGYPHARFSKVKAVISEDREEALFEVVDSYNATRIITEFTDECPWVEVEL